MNNIMNYFDLRYHEREKSNKMETFLNRVINALSASLNQILDKKENKAVNFLPWRYPEKI